MLENIHSPADLAHLTENIKKPPFGNGGIHTFVHYYETRFLFDGGGSDSFRAARGGSIDTPAEWK